MELTGEMLKGIGVFLIPILVLVCALLINPLNFNKTLQIEFFSMRHFNFGKRRFFLLLSKTSFFPAFSPFFKPFFKADYPKSKIRPLEGLILNTRQ